MVSFVLDVSSALPLVYDDEVGPDTLRIEQALEEGQVAYVPTLWRYELCSALRQGERRGRVEPDVALAMLDLLGDLAIEEVDASSAYSLLGASRVHGLTAYDTAYLLLAQRLALPLATRDERLRQAAESGEVDLF